MDQDKLEEIAKAYGINLATMAGAAFASWLLTRPRIAKRPLLAKLLYMLAGKRPLP